MWPVVVIVVLCLVPARSSARNTHCDFSVDNKEVIGHCKKVYGPRISCSQELYDHLYGIYRIYQELKRYHWVHDTEDYMLEYSKLKALFDNVTKIVKEAITQELNISNDTCISMDALQTRVQHVHKAMRLYTDYYYWKQYIYPSLGSLLFMFGMVGNVMIIIRYFKYQALQTECNKIVLNLALADILVLVCYVPLICIFPNMIAGAAESFWDAFTNTLYVIPVNVSIFLLVFLSFMRFLATIATPGSRSQELIDNKKKINRVLVLFWVSLAAMWVLYVVLGWHLDKKITQPLAYLYFILLCPLSLILITVFSVTSARVLRKSIPGEETPAILQETRARRRGAKLLISFVFLFLLTHVPVKIIAIIPIIIDSPLIYEPSAAYITLLLTVLFDAKNVIC